MDFPEIFRVSFPFLRNLSPGRVTHSCRGTQDAQNANVQAERRGPSPAEGCKWTDSVVLKKIINQNFRQEGRKLSFFIQNLPTKQQFKADYVKMILNN